MASTELLPQRLSAYDGLLTDTSRWDSFRMRNDDVFVCTPPKCGTTWTQAICALLIFDSSSFEGKLTDISPWFDSRLQRVEESLHELEAQTHRRFVKTHTPLDGIPYFASAVYLIVYRDPRDTYFSVRNHMLNMTNPPKMPQLAADACEGFRAWLTAPFEPGVGEQRSLEAFVHHFRSYWEFRHLENFHFFHYSNMKRDLKATVLQIASILNIELTENRLEELCGAASFSEMKKKASSFAPGGGKGFFKSDASFFNSGSNAQWREVLSDKDLDSYANRMSELLSPAEVIWLENGSGRP